MVMPNVMKAFEQNFPVVLLLNLLLQKMKFRG